MVGELVLCGFQEFPYLIPQFFNLLKFCEISFAAIEELAILAQEGRHVALKILDLEIARRFVARGCFPFLLCWPGFFLLNKRHAPWPLGCRVLLIGLSVWAPIEW